jgi:hypothetical protein
LALTRARMILVAMKLNDGRQIVSKSYRYDLRE